MGVYGSAHIGVKNMHYYHYDGVRSNVNSVMGGGWMSNLQKKHYVTLE